MAASLQRKLTPIICELEFGQKGKSSKSFNAIEGSVAKIKIT
jgi:hypothetical protein